MFEDGNKPLTILLQVDLEKLVNGLLIPILQFMFMQIIMK